MQETSLRCPACGTGNPDDSSFCTECGVAFAEQVVDLTLDTAEKFASSFKQRLEQAKNPKQKSLIDEEKIGSDEVWIWVIIAMLVIAPIALMIASLLPTTPVAIGIAIFIIFILIAKGDKKDVER